MTAAARRCFLYVSVGLIALASASRAEATPIVFNPANGHYYTLSSGSQNWAQAEAEGVSLGGHLVSITSQAEQDFIVQSFLSGGQAYWIGANDVASEGSFAWTTGEAFTYSFWNPGEPNNCGFCGFSGGEQYVAINFHYWNNQQFNHLGTWNDTTLTATENTSGIYVGILEFNSDPTAVPEPASLLLLGSGLFVIVRRVRQRR